MGVIPETTDVLVIGAGASGIPAAIGAARAGARVLLVEEDALPGGAAVDQYVSMPCGGPRSGVVSEILSRLEQDHALTHRPVDRWWGFWYLPCDVARVAEQMLESESKITTVRSTRVEQLLVEEKSGRPRVTGALVPCRDGRVRAAQAKVVVEATGEGVLAERAGCVSRYGEDSRADFGEELAPAQRSDRVQQCTWMYISQRIAGRGDAGAGWDPGGLASGGREMNARKAFERGESPTPLRLHWGSRVDCSDTRDPAALGAAGREAMEQMKPKFDELGVHGWTMHLSPRLGVRETRRILGEYVITADDLIAGRVPEDSILVTLRGFDLWRRGRHQMQGYPPVRPYGLPYRALVPRGVDGLLVVGKAMSGTHLAMSAYRSQTLLGQVGQAAGVAAAICARRAAQPRSLDFADLGPALTAEPQNMVIRSDAAWVDPQVVFARAEP